MNPLSNLIAHAQLVHDNTEPEDPQDPNSLELPDDNPHQLRVGGGFLGDQFKEEMMNTQKIGTSSYELFDYMNQNFDYKDNYKLKAKVHRKANHYFSAQQDIWPLPRHSAMVQAQADLFRKRPKTR